MHDNIVVGMVRVGCYNLGGRIVQEASQGSKGRTPEWYSGNVGSSPTPSVIKHHGRHGMEGFLIGCLLGFWVGRFVEYKAGGYEINGFKITKRIDDLQFKSLKRSFDKVVRQRDKLARKLRRWE